jgi:hypothetical protein
MWKGCSVRSDPLPPAQRVTLFDEVVPAPVGIVENDLLLRAFLGGFR